MRAGRKRAVVEAREPNGRASRSAVRDDPLATVRAQRLRCGATLENFRAQEHATPLGRLFMAGAFHHPMDEGRAKARYDAGVWYRGLWLAKQRALSLPQPHVRAPGSPSGPAREMDADESLRAIHKETRALNCVPRDTRAVVYSVIVLESPEMHTVWLYRLIAALDALAEHRARG